MSFYNRLNQPTGRPVTNTQSPQTTVPDKRALYNKIWNRHVQQPKTAAVVLTEVIDLCRKQGADYLDVMTTAIAAQNQDAADDATLGE